VRFIYFPPRSPTSIRGIPDCSDGSDEPSPRFGQHVRTTYKYSFFGNLVYHSPSTWIRFQPHFLNAIMHPPSAKPVLEQLKEKYLNSSWFCFNIVEPRIGDPDCPALADEQGLRGQSCYIVFVINRGPRNFGCIEEGCMAFSIKTVEAALRHQRAYHFGHNPFVCFPNSGELWCVSLSLSTPTVASSWFESRSCSILRSDSPSNFYSGKRFYCCNDLKRHQARCHS